MHRLCQTLVDCAAELRADPLAARALSMELRETLAACESGESVSVANVVSRLVGVLVDHPLVRARFVPFLTRASSRAGFDPPPDLPPLDELRHALRLVLNNFVVAHPPSAADFAVACLSQPDPRQPNPPLAHAGPHDTSALNVPSTTQPGAVR